MFVRLSISNHLRHAICPINCQDQPDLPIFVWVEIRLNGGGGRPLCQSKCNELIASVEPYQYLEFLVQFFLNPVGNVSQSDFSLSQFGSGLQFQVRWSPEAVPATEKVQISSVARAFNFVWLKYITGLLHWLETNTLLCETAAGIRWNQHRQPCQFTEEKLIRKTTFIMQRF